ncbi:senescence-associated carboxylesterase 101-like protein [Tanacetum coccineum]
MKQLASRNLGVLTDVVAFLDSGQKVARRGDKIGGLDGRLLISTTRFLNGEFDLVSSRDHKILDFISTKVNPSFSINRAAVDLFESLSFELKELQNELIHRPLVVTGRSVGGYLAILFTLWLQHAVDVEESNGYQKAKRPICITYGTPLLDPVPTLFSSSATYKPFGTYLFCTESGRHATFEDQELVQAILEVMASSSARNVEMHNYEEDLISVRRMVLYRGGTELGKSEFNSLKARITFQLLEVGLVDTLNNGLNDIIENIEEKQAMIVKSKTSRYKPTYILNEMKIAMMYMERYIKAKKLKGGYYSCYKNTESSDEIIKYKHIMDQLWKTFVKEKDAMPQMERLKLRNRWLYTGTNYRRMVEPLDIAEYYKNGSRNYMAFRPNHHTLLEKWLVEDQQDRQPNGRTNETTSLTNDSCFWVYVEEAVLSLRDLEEGGSTQSVTKIEQGLAGFEANVQRALAVVRSRWKQS